MRKRLFCLFLFLPSIALADGVMISNYTLDVLKIALLAKVVFYDPQSHVAKVKIQKILKRTPKETTSMIEASAASMGVDVIQQKDWSKLKVNDEVKLQIAGPPESSAGEWISYEQYWNRIDKIEVGTELIFLSQGAEFEATKSSSEVLSKIEILFDEPHLDKKIQSLSVAELQKLLSDQDFFSRSVNELMLRKKMDVKFISQVDDEELFREIIQYISVKFPAETTYEFWDSLAKRILSQAKSKQFIFLRHFNNHGKGFSMKERLSLLSLFSVQDSELKTEIGMIFYQIKEQLNQKDFSALEPSANLFIEFFKNGKTEVGSVTINDYLSFLPENKKLAIFEELTDLSHLHIHKQHSLDQYYIVVDNFEKLGSARGAWKLTQIDFEKMRTQEKERLFNAILAALFKHEDLSKDEVKKKILLWTNPFLAWAMYPIQLSSLNKENYLKIGGYFYSELDQLRLELQNNNAELAAKFRYYFDRAIYVEVLKFEKRTNTSTIELKVLDAWGDSEPSGESTYYKDAVNINRKLKKGESVVIGISDSSLATIEKSNLKKFILAYKPSQSQFLIFEESYLKQISKLF
jgi:hypothetical protein